MFAAKRKKKGKTHRQNTLIVYVFTIIACSNKK